MGEIHTLAINGNLKGIKKGKLIIKMTNNLGNDTTIKIAVAGNVDSGKSTLAGVLLNDCLDDGRGKCRSMILRNKHELDTGRTSCISFNNLVLNQKDG